VPPITWSTNSTPYAPFPPTGTTLIRTCRTLGDADRVVLAAVGSDWGLVAVPGFLPMGALCQYPAPCPPGHGCTDASRSKVRPLKWCALGE
jgi:hypothetical protein